MTDIPIARTSAVPQPETRLTLRPQEIPLEAPKSCYMFRPSAEKPFVVTTGAMTQFGEGEILTALWKLEDKARTEQGLDYLQVFEVAGTTERLWFIEDDDGGAITALLPDEY